MHSLHDADRIARIASAGAGTVAAGIGAYHLVAWLSGAMTYRGFETITMKTNAALALFLSAAAVIIVAVGRERRFLRIAARILASLVMSIGLLTLLQHLFGLDFDIDQMLAYEPPGAIGILHPNRMGPPGAVTYTLGGAALLLLTMKGKKSAQSAQGLALFLCIVALLGMLGYLYGVRGLYGAARFTVIALPATIGNFFLGLGLLFARPTEGLMAPVTYPDVGGAVLRRLLPAAAVIPVLLGWLRLQGEWHGLYERLYGTVLLVVSLTVIFLIIVYKTGTKISRVSAAERKAQEEAQVQRRLLESVIDNMPAGIFVARGDDLRIVLVNPQYQALAAGKEMIGKTVEEVWPEIQPWFGDIQRQVAASGEPHYAVDERIMLTRAHGAPLEERFFTWSTVRVPLPADQGWGVLTTAWETTERKRAEEELRTARDLLNGILEGSGSNVAAAGLDLRILALNAAYRQEFTRLFQVEPHIGDHMGDLLSHLPEEQEKALAVWRRALSGEPFIVEQEYGLDDRRSHYEIRFSPIRDAHGSLIGATQISVDITGRKRDEEALRASEAQFRAVFEQAAVGIGRVSFADARWMDINEAFVHMLGYSSEEMRATPWPEMTHPEDVDLDLIPFRRMAAGELETYDVEKRFIHKDGRHVWARLTLSLVRDAFGRPDYEIAIVEDITERKRAEQELMENEQLLKNVLAILPVGLWILNREGNVVQANEKAKEIWGGARFVGMEEFGEFRGWRVDTGERILPGEWAGARAITHGETSIDEEVEIEGFDGSRKIILDSAVPIRNERGEITGAVTVNQDITHRKRAEEALRESEARFRGIFDNAAVGISLFDRSRKLVRANAKLCNTLGYSEDELRGRSFDRYTHAEDHEPDLGNYALLMRGEVSSYTVEKRYIKKDGSDLWVRVTRSAQPGPRNLPEYSINIVEDIGARKQAENELRRLLAELQRSNQDLQQFAYVASHDLQEPLRMVSSYMELLDRKYRDRLDDKARMYIHYAVDGTTRMQNLIDGLLSYSRISRKKAFSAVDANAACAAALANLEQAVRESAGEVMADTLPTVSGEPVQLVQLFQNLIGNALKYRKPEVPPRVRVSAWQTGEWWTFAISDNGIGIEAQHRDQVFQIFQRLHTKEEYPGTGIGLASCKKIVERHGGKIWLESTPGEGSTFYFTLPVVPLT